jgi:D-3-phosphoglycerate dehydrogenase
MLKVLITDKLSDLGMDVFKREKEIETVEAIGKTPEELKAILGDYDGWVIRSGTTATADLIKAATKLKVIGRAGVGVDNVDSRDYCDEYSGWKHYFHFRTHHRHAYGNGA